MYVSNVSPSKPSEALETVEIDFKDHEIKYMWENIHEAEQKSLLIKSNPDGIITWRIEFYRSGSFLGEGDVRILGCDVVAN